MIYAEAFLVGLLGWSVASTLLRDLNVFTPVLVFGVGAAWGYARMPPGFVTGVAAVAAAVVGVSIAVVGHAVANWYAPDPRPVTNDTGRKEVWRLVTWVFVVAGSLAFALGAGLGALVR